jgi:ligand-binding sensor domain-containing protein
MKMLISIIFFFSPVLWVCAQNTIALPLIKNYAKSDYKAGSQTWDMSQGKDNRMYFGNNEGLLVFDGVYWKLFPLPNKTIVRSVRILEDGKIFVGGQGDAGYFSPGAGGNLVYHSLLNVIPERSRDFADVWDIEVLNESIFFRATSQIMLYQNGQVEIFPAPNEWVYMSKVGNTILAQDKLKGLFFWSGQSWQQIENGGLQGSDMFKGYIPLGGDSTLMVTYYNKNFLLTGNAIFPARQITQQLKSEIVAISPIGKNHFAVGTTSEGCIIIDKNGDLVQQISKVSGLQDNSVLSLYEDRQGNVWTALNSGISLVAYGAPVKFIKPVGNNDLSAYDARVFEGRLFLATNEGAYSTQINREVIDYSFLKSPFQKVPSTNGLAYRLDEINKTLLMAHNDGVFQIKSNSAEKISAEPSWLFLPIDRVYPTQRVLVGTYAGLKWLQFERNSFLGTPNLTGIKESFRFLVLDNQNSIWSSHPYRGIFRIKIYNDSSRYSTELFTNENGLPSRLDNHVFHIKNRVVFATAKGVYEFDKSESLFAPSPYFAPIFGDLPIRYLKEDQKGNIWFVSDKKIGYLEFLPAPKDSFRITYFSELEGRILSGFENVYPYNQENIFIAAEKGMLHVNLKNYLNRKEKLRLSISSVHIIGRGDSVIYNGFRENLSAPLVIPSTIPNAFNSLHIEYSESSFGFHENITYSYMLEGYDEEWSKWSAKPEKDYTNLPGGTYTFKVKARNNLGNETEIESFEFTIAPPWYQSTVARICYFLFFCLGLYLLYNYHRKKLARQKLIFEEKQEQLRVLHQLEIEKNEKEIIRLQNAKLANEVSFKNKELADTTLHLVERSDALNKVKDTLQRLYKNDSNNSDLKKALHLLNDIEKNDSDWDKFAASFDEINNDFLKKLRIKFPGLTHNDQKLCAYLQLNLSSKEIAQLLNISIRGVEISRYRLRKKLGIPTEKAIGDFLNEVVISD